MFLKYEHNVIQKPKLFDYYPEYGSRDLRTVEGVDWVVQVLLSVLYTPRGTVFYGRDLGTRIARYLYEPLDETTKAGILEVVNDEITSSLGAWARVNVRDIVVDSKTKSIQLMIDIQYGEELYTITHTLRVEEKIV